MPAIAQRTCKGKDIVQPSRFGELLRHHRLAASLTQEDQAEKARLSARAISDLERGLYRAPRRESFALLLQALPLSEAVELLEKPGAVSPDPAQLREKLDSKPQPPVCGIRGGQEESG
jgi:transcriptional regulator with XRE-family HTH domain